MAERQEDRLQKILSLFGKWSDLDWDTMEKELYRIRHESKPSPPLSLGLEEDNVNEADYLAILWHEFFAEPGSFLIKLRVERRWDKEAFDRLTEAMRKCCKEYEQKQKTEEYRLQYALDKVPRWLASGFWFLSHEARDITSHPAWDERRKQEPEYFNKAYERLDSLALWFFEGQCPWRDEEKGWRSTIVEI